jgi:hypothetical protein
MQNFRFDLFNPNTTATGNPCVSEQNANKTCTGYPYYSNDYFPWESINNTGPLVTVANSTAANIEMGNPPSLNADKQGIMYGYTFPYNISMFTLTKLGYGSVNASNVNWNVWTNISWPLMQGQMMGSGALGLGLL